MLLKRGKTVNKFFKSIMALLLIVTLVTAVMPPHFQIKAASYELDGLRNPDGSLVYGINYTPAHYYGWMPGVMAGEKYIPEKIEEELTHIKAMGYNSIRLIPTLYDGLYSQTDAAFANTLAAYEEKYRTLFDICRKLELTATIGMLPIPANGGDYKTKGGKIEKTLEMFVKRLGVDYKDVIILWEISNEPDVNTFGLSYADSVKAFEDNETWNNVTKPFLESAAKYMDEFYAEYPEYDIPYSIGCMNSARCDSWDAETMEVLNIHTYKRTNAESEAFMNEAYALDMATLGEVRPVVLSEVMMSGMLQPADDIIEYCKRNNVAFYVWGYSAISFEQGFQGLVDLTGRTRISTLPLEMITDADEIMPLTTAAYDLTAGGLNEYYTPYYYLNSVINSGSTSVAAWENAVEHFYNWARYIVPYYTESFAELYNSASGDSITRLKYIADSACTMAIPYIRTYGTYKNDNALGGSETANYHESLTKYNTNDGINTFRSRFAFGKGISGSKAILMQGYNSLTVGRATSDGGKYAFTASVKPLVDSSATVGVMCRQDAAGTNPGLYFKVTGEVSDAVRASYDASSKIKAYKLSVYGVADSGATTVLKETSLYETDFNSDGYLELNIEYSGLGTASSPLKATVYIGGEERLSGSFTGLNSSGTVTDCYPSLNTPDTMGAYFDNIVLKDLSSNKIILSDSFEAGKADYDYLVYDIDLNRKGSYPGDNNTILDSLISFRNSLNIKETENSVNPEITAVSFEGKYLNISWNYGGSGEYGFEIQRSRDGGNTWQTYWRVAPDCFSATIPAVSAQSDDLYRVCVVTNDNGTVKPSAAKAQGFEKSLVPDAYYSFEDTANLGVDSSGNYKLLVSSNAKSVVTSETGGVSGNAVHFGTLDSYDLFLYSDDMLEAAENFTVSAFAKLDSGITEGNYTIFSNGWDNAGGFSFGFSSHEWMYICADVSGGEWLAFNLKSSTNNQDFSAYDWHNYTLTLENGNILKVYIDGTLAFTYTFTEKLNTVNPESAFNIGSTYNGGYHLAGSVDETKVFCRTLTAEEIAEIIKIEAKAQQTELVAFYEFEDFGRTGYDSYGNYPLTVSEYAEAVMTPVAGANAGGAVHFGSCDGYVTFLTSVDDIIDGKSDFTISAFAQLDADAVGDNFTIFSNGAWTYGGFTFGFAGHEYIFFHSDATNWIAVKLSDATGKPDFDTSEWHNYAVTVSGGKNLRIYVDGAEIYSVTASADINPADSRVPAALGSTYNGGYKLIGSLDEVLFYHTALSVEEIAEITEPTESEIKAEKSELISHYSFDSPENIGLDNCDSFNMSVKNSSDVTTVNDGVIGGAVYIGGTSADLPLYNIKDAIDGEADFTVSAFVMLENTAQSGKRIIFSNGGFGNNGISFGLNGEKHFIVSVGGNAEQGFDITEKIADFNPYTWHNYTVTVSDRRELRVYIDGRKVFSTAYSNTINVTDMSTPSVIGAAFNGDYVLGGYVDEVKLYRRALSAGEISDSCDLFAPDIKAPVAEFTFDNASKVGEDSYGKHMLINCGTVTVSTDAKFGEAALFTGANWQSALYYNGSDFTDNLSEITVTCYAKLTAESTGNMCLLSTGWDPNGGISFGITGGSWVFLDATSNGTAVWKSAKADIKTNEWHYYSLAISNGGKVIKIAVDGEIIITATLENPVKFKNTDYSLTIGQNAWLGGYAFTGMLDELRIYDYGMSEEELIADYNAISFVKKADINADDSIDIRDLVCAKKYFAGVKEYACIANLDIDSNYRLEVIDLLNVRKLLLGISD